MLICLCDRLPGLKIIEYLSFRSERRSLDRAAPFLNPTPFIGRKRLQAGALLVILRSVSSVHAVRFLMVSTEAELFTGNLPASFEWISCNAVQFLTVGSLCEFS